MKLSVHNSLLKLLKVPKHELLKVIRAHVNKREKTETVYRTKSNLLTWYKNFTKFIYQYDIRTVTLNNAGIAGDYVTYMEDRGFANGYIKQQFQLFSATITRLGIHHDFQPKELFRNHARESKANEDYFLTNEEVKELLNLNLKDRKESIVMDRFIIGCFTGTRQSEITSVEKFDEKTLRYTSNKTQKDVKVPYNEIVRPYIESANFKNKLNPFEESHINMFLHIVLKRLKWNKTVRRYKMHGKKKTYTDMPRFKAITFHSGRKFFGKMLLDRGVSMYKVSVLMGHGSITTTERFYASVTREKMMDETNEVINKF